MTTQHPAKNTAQRLSYLSAEYAQQHNKAAWLALFAEDAVVQDPVGVSPLDPSGDGHQGKQAISAFYDSTIAVGRIEMQILHSFAAGDECANHIRLDNYYPDGTHIKLEMISIYRANAAGELVALRAFWDFAEVAAQLSSSA